MKNSLKVFRKGFTLIELLIVIAILGILATAVLVALDPSEQLNRGKDAGMISNVGQIGHAVQAYYTGQAAYPPAASWDTSLTGSGDLKRFPSAPTGWGTCASNMRGNGYCYYQYPAVNPTDVVVYARVVSKDSGTKVSTRSLGGLTCTSGNTGNQWVVFNSQLGKTGLWCGTEPSVLNIPATVY